MNRANAPKALNKAKTQKKPAVAKKAKVQKKKVQTKPTRNFRTSRAQRSHLYSHHEVYEGTEAAPSQIISEPMKPNLEKLSKETQDIVNVAPNFECSSDINRRTSFTIFKPCKNSMQNEKNDNWSWRIREDRGRGDETNLLVGDDYYGHDQGIYPEFFSQNDAIEYCKANNFPFVIAPEPMRRYDLRSYADNFAWKGLPKVDDV